MNTNIISSLTGVPDQDLLSRLADLARHERGVTVELIGHLVELDARKLYRAEGYGSLFRYCTDALRLSEHAAYCRIEAAHIARTFPVVLDRLADGSLNLTTLGLIGPHLRPENQAELLAQVAGRSKRDVQALVARLAPQPDVPASIRKLPAPPPDEAHSEKSRPDAIQSFVPVTGSTASRAPAQVPLTDPGAGRAALDGHSNSDPLLPIQPSSPRTRPPVVAPLSPERYRIQFTVGAETHDKLRLIQDLLRGEVPDGDPALIFDRGLTLLLEDTAKRKVAAVSRPRTGSAGSTGSSSRRSRHVPAEVKRSVWVRDRNQCAFVAKDGRRCTERSFLEFHHVEPYGVGGETITSNISLRCRSHNIYEAELVYGPDVMKVRQSTPARTRSGPSSRESEKRTEAGLIGAEDR
jgi:hypothetical protein